MKKSALKMVFVLSCAILLLSVLVGCGDSGKLSVYSSECNSVSSDLSSSSSVFSSVSSKISSDNSLFDISYEEYFSKEREWVDVTMADGNDYSFEINGEGNVVKFKVEYLKPTDPKFGTMGKRVRRDQTVIFAGQGNVTEFTPVYDKLFLIVNGHQIIEVDKNGGNKSLIYEDNDRTKPISNIVATRELIYFEKEHTIFRLYRKSGTLDEIMTKEEMTFWRPLSNYTVMWYELSPKWKEYLASGGDPRDEMQQTFIGTEIAFIHNAKTGEEKEIVADKFGVEYRIDE